jgi:hypothetical protein
VKEKKDKDKKKRGNNMCAFVCEKEEEEKGERKIIKEIQKERGNDKD